MPPKTPSRPPASRSSSGAVKSAKKEGHVNGNATVGEKKANGNGNGNGVVITNGTPKHPHTGPEFSDSVTFVTPPPTPAKTNRPSPTTRTSSTRKPAPARPSILSVLLRLSLLSLLAYTFVCPPLSTASPPPAITGPCTLLARAHTDVYTPYLAPPLSSAWTSALANPTTAPYAQRLENAYGTVEPYVSSARAGARRHLLPIIAEAQSEISRLSAILSPYISPYVSKLEPYLAHATEVYRVHLRAHFLTLRSQAHHTLHTLSPYVIQARRAITHAWATSLPYLRAALAWLQSVGSRLHLRENIDKYVTPALARIMQRVGEIQHDAGEAAAPVLSRASEAVEAAHSSAGEMYASASAGVSSAASAVGSKAAEYAAIAQSRAASLTSAAASAATSVGSSASSVASAASARASSASDNLSEGAVSIQFAAASLASSAYAAASSASSTASSYVSAAQETIASEAGFVAHIAQSSVQAARSEAAHKLEELREAVGIHEGDPAELAADAAALLEHGTGAVEALMEGTEEDEEDEEFEKWFAKFIPGEGSAVATETAEVLATVEEAQVPATTATEATSQPKWTQATPEEVAAKRADIEATHSRWEETLTAVGEGALGRLERVIARVRGESAAKLDGGDESEWGKEVASYEREVGRVVNGVEKYATKLRGEDRPAEEKTRMLREVVEKVRAQVEKWAGEVEDKLKLWWTGSEAVLVSDVEKAEKDVMDVAGDAQAELGMQYAWLEDVTVHDWTRYHALVKNAKAYAEQYRTLLYLDSEQPLYRALAGLTEHIQDVLLGFEARLALIHPFADAPVSGADDQDSFLSQDPPQPAKPRHDPLFIPGVKADSGTGAEYLKKSKEEVERALQEAEAAAAQILQDGKETAEEYYDFASAQVSGAVHEATRTVIKAAGGTPSPESFGEHVESLVDAASQGIHQATRSVISAAGGTPSPESLSEHVESVRAAAESAYGAATSNVYENVKAASSVAESVYGAATSNVAENVHQATRAAHRAVGGTPTPETVEEYYDFAAAQAGEKAQAAYDAASGAIHGATRTVIRAAGGTPTPESVHEHYESVVARVQDATEDVLERVNEILSSASAAIEDVAGEATGLAESVYAAGSSAVHDATRTVIKAAGGTPSPESFAEHVESLVGAASEAAHQATRTIIKAAGGTPSPESLKEHYESVVARASEVILDPAADVLDSVYASAHSATREAYKAMGGTPTPETFGEHYESVVAQATDLASDAYSSAASAASVVSDTVSSAGSEALDSASSLASVVSGSASSAASVAYDSGSSVVHHATRTAMTAVGTTPSPENLSETVSSLSARASDSYASAASIIDSLASDAADTYTSVTDSVKSAAGVQTAKPLTERALSSAASVLDSLASEASSATDSVKSAAGVETAKPVTERASSSVVSAASSVSSAVSSIYHQEL